MLKNSIEFIRYMAVFAIVWCTINIGIFMLVMTIINNISAALATILAAYTIYYIIQLIRHHRLKNELKIWEAHV